VEVLPQGRSGFVEGGYEVGVAVSPTVDRFVGDVDDLGGLCVDRAGEEPTTADCIVPTVRTKPANSMARLTTNVGDESSSRFAASTSSERRTTFAKLWSGAVGISPPSATR
jgi:hypothetical protein